MAGNPNIAQGTLNRLRASIVVVDSAELNITASFLDDAGISLSFEGETTAVLGTLVGTVQSPNPYQIVMIRAVLLKSQSLSQQYEARRQSNSLIGNVNVIPDAATLATYNIINCSIQNVAELSFAGRTAGYPVSIKGYLPINNALWDAA